MKRILVVSNRLPFSITKKGEELALQPSVGGLATGLGSFYRSHDCIWTGWPGVYPSGSYTGEHEKIADLLRPESCNPVYLSRYEIEHYYHGFSNSTLWPLFHYFRSMTSWDKKQWSVYKKVNRKFCGAVLDIYQPGDMIWVHDYHLLLLPSMLRKELDDAAIGFFNHIPFPSYEMFRVFPGRKEVIEGMLGADLVGFHTYDYTRHFLTSVRRLTGYEHNKGLINAGDHVVQVDTFPMGIDYTQFAGSVDLPEVQKETRRIRKKYGKTKILLSFDRLDYTKGIPRRLLAYDAFLEKYPEYRGKIILILIAVPSRTAVRHYRLLKQEVDEQVGYIIGKYGTIDWTPISYFYHKLPFSTLAALYHAADVALVTPLRDGMNLMAKEYLATKTDGRGVLVLSEMAGAANELGEAVVINPFNPEEFVEAIRTALTMPENEQIERNRLMQQRLRVYHVRRWASDFVQHLTEAKEQQAGLHARHLSAQYRRKLLDDFGDSNSRLIILDYDGTLVPFASRPEKAVPDEKLIRTLNYFSKMANTSVVIISGRDKDTLEEWFGNTGAGMVAEHGTGICEPGSDWVLQGSMQNDWKEDILPIVTRFMERTPGSFIEEKEYSLVWHFRRADPDLGAARAIELKDLLHDICANRNLEAMEGNKIIEVKNAGINKGLAAMHWIARKDWDFILATGDDRTDEYLFDVLPPDAYSIKVGPGASKARYNLAKPEYIRGLLDEMALQRDD